MYIDEFIKGWLVGDFEPTLIKNKDIEVGVKYYKKGDIEKRHVHKYVTEYTIVLSGKIVMLDKVFYKKNIVKVEPGIATNFEALTDCITLVIKTPSIPSDKEFV